MTWPKRTFFFIDYSFTHAWVPMNQNQLGFLLNEFYKYFANQFAWYLFSPHFLFLFLAFTHNFVFYLDIIFAYTVTYRFDFLSKLQTIINYDYSFMYNFFFTISSAYFLKLISRRSLNFSLIEAIDKCS